EERLPPLLNKLDESKRVLFQRFTVREGVKSFARLFHRVNGRVEAILFVNFSNTVRFDHELKQRLHYLLQDMVKLLPGIMENLQQAEPFSGSRVLRMAQAVCELDELGLPGNRRSFNGCLDQILDAAFDALQL